MTTTPGISPDATPAVDLTLFDLTSQDLVDQALADATSKFPDWVPRESNTEVVLLETQALLQAETIYAVNRLPQAVLAALLQLYGITPDPGVRPTTTITFTVSGAGTVTVPAGTRLAVSYGTDGFAELTTDVDLVITTVSGAGTGTVAATFDDALAAVNGPTPGSLELLDAVSPVDSVAFGSDVVGGVDPETVDAFLQRGSQLLRRLVSTLVLPEHFTAELLADTTVYRAFTIDLYDPATGPSPGSNPGHVTVAALKQGGGFFTSAEKAAFVTDLQTKCLASLQVHMIDPTVTTVAVTVDVTARDGYTAAQVQANVTAAIQGYLSTDTWPWAATVYRNDLIALVTGATGVARVNTLTAPSADVALAGYAPLASAGTVTVTVS